MFSTCYSCSYKEYLCLSILFGSGFAGKNPMGSAKENSALSGFSGHSKPTYGGMAYKRNSNDLGEICSYAFTNAINNPDLRTEK